MQDVVRGEDTYNARLTQADIAFIHPSDSVTKPQKGSQPNLNGRGAIGKRFGFLLVINVRVYA